jgi:hypothetical protein
MDGVSCSSTILANVETGTKNGSSANNSINSVANDSSHIVGPVIARDAQIMDQYLPATNEHSLIRPSRIQGGFQRPIYHSPVPPRRPNLHDHRYFKEMPNELLDQVSPFLDKLVSVYYEDLHPAFPILDDHAVMAGHKGWNTLPKTLQLNLVAYTLFYWDTSPALATSVRPNQDFAWQLVVSSNISDLHKSDLSTIVAVTLNAAGRPSTCLVNNTTQVARIVALSHAIGLNYDCSKWDVPETERHGRWKAWWGVVVHDRWFNFAQGTPPYISRDRYDVPLPTLEMLTANRNGSAKHVYAAEVYIQLCKLTEIVGDILPLIYQIRSRSDNITNEKISKLEFELTRWTESNPTWLNLTDYQNRPTVPGLANLQLCFLSVRMLLCRIAWHEISQREADPEPVWLLNSQAAAEDIVKFVESLKTADLQGFWLPYNAQHFISAVTLLLRCALQTSHTDTRKQCMASARTLVNKLRHFSDVYKWDMAETVLFTSDNILKQIEAAISEMATTKSRATTQVFANELVDTEHVEETGLDYSTLQDDEFMAYLGQNSLEEMFPDIFSDFTCTAFSHGAQL